MLARQEQGRQAPRAPAPRPPQLIDRPNSAPAAIEIFRWRRAGEWSYIGAVRVTRTAGWKGTRRL